MYAKVFTQILDSSLAENFTVRHIFEDLLKLCDQNGVIDMTREAIARRLNCPIEIVSSSITALEQPDNKSRTPDHEGRRITRIDAHRDWGWLVVNFAYYRAIATEEQRREKTRLRVERFREKQKEVVESKELTTSVTHGNATVTPPYAFASASTSEGKGESKGGKRIADSTVIPLELDTAEFHQVWAKWLAHLKQKRKPATLHAQDLQLHKLTKFGNVQKAIETINHCIEHNWCSIYEKKQEHQNGSNKTNSLADIQSLPIGTHGLRVPPMT